MAESIVSLFVERLSDLVLLETGLFGEVEGQIKVLRNELEWMRLFLKDADSKRIYDEKIKLWVNQIRDVTFDAEDVIDEFIFNMDLKRQQRLDNLRFLKLLPTCISFADKLPFIHELDARIKDINFVIEKIMANKSKYGLETLTASSSSAEAVPQKERRAPVVEEIDVVGIEDDTEAVKRMLIDEEKEILIQEGLETSGASSTFTEDVPWKATKLPPDEEMDVARVEDEEEMVKGKMIKEEKQLPVREKKVVVVVSIVGMGGLGKTTLAKRVYNHTDVKQHFDCRAWVYVSQEYSITELLMGIADSVGLSLTDEQKMKIKEGELGRMLQSQLKAKKYLIVLDDVWSLNVWNVLSSYFPESSKSRVLVTTRNNEIALQSDSRIYEPRVLNEEKSWDLFLKKTFQVEDTTNICPPQLQKVGKKIVKRCGGLPLAIVVIGGLLSRHEKTSSSWNRLFKSIEWHLNQGPDSCIGILALSYNNLPYYLKPCFLYCGLFPEDSEIRTTKLIQLWIAEGFIQTKGEETMEEIAEDYLEELIHRSMIQVAKRRIDGSVKSCQMHDLLRDLAISEGKDSKFFEVGKRISSTSPVSARRIVVHAELTKSKNAFSPVLHSSRVRSLVSFTREWGEILYLRSFLKGFKLLTVLDLEGIGEIYTLPNEIGKLLHLKYLCLKKSDIKRLPWSIGSLVNLQTLDLRYSDIESIPYAITKLQNLRHLYGLPNGLKLSQPMMHKWLKIDHMRIDQLPNLQTLGLEVGNSGRLEESCFEKLNQITTLRIRGSLEKLPELYPPNLVKLKLRLCKLSQDPMHTLRKLPNLKFLELGDGAYEGTEMVWSIEGFPQLQILRLDRLWKLEELKVEEGAMLELRALRIENCTSMKKFPDGLLNLKNLERLQLNDMPPELREEVKTREGKDWDNIRRITSIA